MNFTEWHASHEGEIEDALVLMSVPLSDEPEELWHQSRDIEARLGRMQYLVAVADAYLDKAESAAINDIIRECGAKGIPAYEKEVRVKARCSPERETRDILTGPVDSIKTRIMLSQSRLSYLKSLSIGGV